MRFFVKAPPMTEGFVSVGNVVSGFFESGADTCRRSRGLYPMEIVRKLRIAGE